MPAHGGGFLLFGDNMDYQEFLRTKHNVVKSSGFDVAIESLNEKAFEWQKHIVKWAVKKGKCALFEDCGLGKTIQQLMWGHEVHKKTGGNILILAPLAVANQTMHEGEKFGIPVTVCRKQEDVKDGINITNYEMLSHFEPDEFIGVVLDESSILKSFSSKTKMEIIDRFQNTPYRLSCTATPSPNDYEELGNQSEFLGIMSRLEMLSMFFVHDSGDTSKWKIKGHASDLFWDWVSNWAVVITSPKDLGFNEPGFDLPKLNFYEHSFKEDVYFCGDQISLMPETILSMTDRRAARKHTLDERVKIAADIVNETDEQFIVWCDLNSESDMLKRNIENSVEVKGSDTPEHKTKAAEQFLVYDVKNIISKPSIFGWGLNWQHCNNMVFVGLSDSYEQFYQAVRRCYRFGQKKPVNVHIVISEREGAVLENIKRKEAQAQEMVLAMVQHTKKVMDEEIHGTKRETTTYTPREKIQMPLFF